MQMLKDQYLEFGKGCGLQLLVKFENIRIGVSLRMRELIILEVFVVAQRKVWTWITSKEKDAKLSYSDWCLKPTICMNFVN